MTRAGLFRAGLFCVGVLLAGAATLLPLPGLGAGIVQRERFEVSAPILPRVLVLCAMEGANYPSSTAGEKALAHDSALTFEFLLTSCAATNPEIVVPKVGDPPTTPQQNASNYEAIARCAYEKFTSKPYWIPALVDQVDICGTELGKDWRLISEVDLSALTERDAQFLADSLSTPQAGTFFGNFYFALRVWVRGTDGSLKQGDLSPGVSARVSELPVASDSKTHHEGALALRCMRRTKLPSDTN